MLDSTRQTDISSSAPQIHGSRSRQADTRTLLVLHGLLPSDHRVADAAADADAVQGRARAAWQHNTDKVVVENNGLCANWS